MNTFFTICNAVLFLFFFVISPVVIFSQVDDPNLDRKPAEYYQLEPRSFLEVITDSQGFDNFNLGLNFAEPHVSQNPNDPLQYFGAFNTNGAWRTYDGLEWISSSPPFGVPVQGDPVTAYDSLGNLYYQNMFGNITGARVIRSTDNGATWGPPIIGINGIDKNWIAADQSAGPYSNYVYCVMTAGGGTGNFTRSTDFGATFVQTRTFSPQNLPGMMVAVGPNTLGAQDVPGGAVYVVTNSGSAFASTYTFYVSNDGGAAFTLKSAQNFANYVGTNVGGRNSVENMRTRPYPFIAADNSYGTYRGRLYLVYASNTPAGNGNKPDIFLRYSDDQGATWSSARLVNDDPNTTQHHQWHPAVWVDKTSGRIFIKWMDTRDTPTSDSAYIYATYSEDGGVSFAPNQRISNQKMKIDCSSCGGGGTPRYQGDYDAIYALDNISLLMWTDFRFGQFGSYVGYFPDFAMTISHTADTLRPGDTTTVTVHVPAVKLYDQSVRFTAESFPPGGFNYEFIGSDSLVSYPDSVRLRIIPDINTEGLFTIRIYGRGPNGTPVHARDIEVFVTKPATTVLKPNGGEELYAGSSYPIRWNSIFVDRVKLEYSTDNGSTWTLIADDLDGTKIGNIQLTSTSSTFDWVVPSQISDECLVRISDSNDPTVFDVSDSVFSIAPAPAPGWVVQSSGVIFNILCIDFIDTLLAFAGTSNGSVLRTTNGGANWQVTSSALGGEVTSISMADHQRILAVVNTGSSTRIRRSLLNGFTWGTVYEDTNPDARLNSIKMLDNQNGYAIGNPVNGQWVILNTTDGGGTWNTISGPAQIGNEKGLSNSMMWIDLMNGWFGTDANNIYRTTDGGVNWSSAFTSTQKTNAVVFNDLLNGVSAGDKIDRTVDGGINWTQAPEQLSSDIISAGAPGHFTGRYYFATGNQIFRTDDQGDSFVSDFQSSENINFITLNLTTADDVNWICGYAVGENGLIVKYLEVILVSDIESYEYHIPETFALKQNYPNPFNPTTRIEFSLPAASDVQLYVYNILGQHVATLVDDFRAPGNYSVTWDASGIHGNRLSSGVYLYQLKAKNSDGESFQSTKKMVLLK